ncbi:MAG: hypothetical protein E7311_03605 [Clostridiales bacterium]|nr:hypothetical protein [Clostridiales bacterium]
MILLNIAVFGGCYPDKEYEEKVYNLFKEKFINKDINIITCGTVGTIEAVCKATKENGLKNIATSLNKWENYINKYIDETHLFDNELDRLKYITNISDMYIVLDGDIGTFEELFVVLEITQDIDKPIYLLGNKVKNALDMLIANEVITDKVLDRFMYVDLIK